MPNPSPTGVTLATRAPSDNGAGGPRRAFTTIIKPGRPRCKRIGKESRNRTTFADGGEGCAACAGCAGAQDLPTLPGPGESGVLSTEYGVPSTESAPGAPG